MATLLLGPFWICAAAWILDALIGDPEKLPHPVRAMGAFIRGLEQAAPRLFSDKKAAGMCIGICAPGAVFILSLALIQGAALVSPWLGAAASVVLIYYCLATRCLADEALSVYRCLQSRDIAAARQRLARIVGRDTADLAEADIVRATVETVGENTVDGIISPLFYAIIGGAPLAMAFKAVSTLDSMIGYKNERYLDLGRFSARLDDALNYIPARLCLVLVPLAAVLLPRGRAAAAYSTGMRDGRNSPSPNSGFPEACFAGALGIRLGGECSYAGVVCRKPLLGDACRESHVHDIRSAVILMWLVSALSLLLFTGAFLMITIAWGC